MKRVIIFALFVIFGSTVQAGEWKNLRKICLASNNGLQGASKNCNNVLAAINLMGTEEAMFRASCRPSTFADGCPEDQTPGGGHLPMPVSYVLEASVIVLGGTL